MSSLAVVTVGSNDVVFIAFSYAASYLAYF